MLVLLLIACQTSDLACREGTTLAEDGHCYPPLLDRSPRIDDVIDALPPCLPATGPGRIDLVGGCAHGVCVGDTFPEHFAVLGAPDCNTTSSDNRKVACDWPDWGVNAVFADDDRDEIPDDGATDERILLRRPSTAATDLGLGVDATIACFFDVLGDPEVLQYRDLGGELLPDAFIWDRYGLRAFDRTGPGDVARPDGYMDELYLYGQ